MPGSPSDAALARVRTICLGFPGTEEKISHGMPSYFVRGKMFLSFVDDHHGDGRLGVWLKSTLEQQRRLVEEEPERFFVPPYVGVKGWVGVVLNAPRTDWIRMAILFEEGWVSVAPARLAASPPTPPKKLPPPPVLARTDPAVAAAALGRLSTICTALPGASVERESKHATFRVGKKPFAYFLDNHHGDGIVSVCVKVDKPKVGKIVAADPKKHYVPAYIGPKGWLGIRLDSKKVDWKAIADRVAASYQAQAPARPTRRRSA